MTTIINSTATSQATKDIIYNRDTKDYSCFLIIDGERNLIGTVERYHEGEVLCNKEYQRLLEDNAVINNDEITEETYNGENETLEGDIEFILPSEFSGTIRDIATDGLTDIAEKYLTNLSWSDRFDAITAIVQLMREVVMTSEREYDKLIPLLIEEGNYTNN